MKGDPASSETPEMVSDAAALVVSSRADRRHRWARRWLRRHGRGYLVLGPTRGAADDFLRVVAREDGAVFGAHRYTLAQLAWLEASSFLAEGSLARLTPLGSQAMAALAVDEVAERLGYLAPVCRLPGFPRALSSTLQELRMAGVAPAHLAALDGPGSDLAALLEAYGQALERWSLADSALVYEKATASLLARSREGGSSRGELDWHGVPTLLLDLPLRSAREVELSRALFALQPEVAMTVSHGDDRTLAAAIELFSVDASRSDLLSLDDQRPTERASQGATAGEQGVSAADSCVAEASSQLERVQRYVFAAEIPLPEQAAADVASPPACGSFDFFSAGGEGQECVEIARRARNLAAKGVPFDQLAILVRQPLAYLPLIEDALRRAEIPAYFSHGTSRPDPAGRAFLALLACAAEGLPASRFAEYLSLGQVPVLEPDASPPVREVPWVEPQGEQLVLLSVLQDGGVAEKGTGRHQDGPQTEGLDPESLKSPAIAGSLPTPARWERLLVDAAVVGGADRWRRRLDGLNAELRRHAREIGDEDEPRRLGIERSLERLGHLRSFALPLVEMLAALPGAAPWGEWIEKLEQIATRSLRRPESVLALLADLRPLRAVGPVGLPQVRRVLEERLGVLRKRPQRRRFGRVFVATLEEAAGRCFDVVFVPGLAEGVFPRRASEDPLLLDDLRQQLGNGLEQQDQRLHSERLLLHLALGAARKRAVLSYPRVDVALGRARVPSFYALDVLRAAEGVVPDLKSLARRAAMASGSLLDPVSSNTGSSNTVSGNTISSNRDDDQGPVLEQAIDAAEYDLALLRDLFHRPAGEALGEGRFLLTVNEHLRRSLHARARRWRKKWTYADGLVASADAEGSGKVLAGFAQEAREDGEPSVQNGAQTVSVAEILAGESPRRRSFSPTALQHFSACPYRFYLQAILRLRPREDRTGFEQLDPLTRGSIFHQMQFELLVELRRLGSLPVTEDNIGAVLEVADRVFQGAIEGFTEELAPAIPRVWESEIESLRNDLRGWLRQVAQQSAPWTPVHFELAFGLPKSADRDSASVEGPATVALGRKVRGAIDLVEIDARGKRLRVTDHKTGRARRERDLVIAGGAVLQPLIYAMAAEQLLGREPGRTRESTDGPRPTGSPDLQVVAGRLYYCTQRGEYSSLEVPLNPEGRRAVEQVFTEVEGALDHSFLPAAPQEGACRWCDYRPVCGPYEERRVQRKKQSWLESLERLRRHR